jgi:catechol-2,3-dioxygenase
MKPHLKAIVLKTSQLKNTCSFFIDQLGFTIKESSPTHFVIHSEGIRILFVQSHNELEVELYLTQKPAKKLFVAEDPNHIKIIVS